VDPSNYLEV
jgi:hypothetical protein